MKRTYSVAILSELRCEEEPEEMEEDLPLLVDMPEDIVYTIVGKLHPRDIGNLLATCRRYAVLTLMCFLTGARDIHLVSAPLMTG